MKLSETIRLGAMAAAPVHGPVIAWEGIDETARPCGACLLGAVLLATEAALSFHAYHFTGTNTRAGGWVEEMYRRIHTRWPWTRADVTWNGFTGPVPNVAMLSFEFGHKTREEIADWIEHIEPQEAMQAWSVVGVGNSE